MAEERASITSDIIWPNGVKGEVTHYADESPASVREKALRSWYGASYSQDPSFGKGITEYNNSYSRRAQDLEGTHSDTLFKLLGYIDRPRAAVVSGLLSGVLSDPTEEQKNVYDEVMKGWFGEQAPSMGEFFYKNLEKVRTDRATGKGNPNNNWSKALDIMSSYVDENTAMGLIATTGGIAGDIAVDPVTYAGIPIRALGQSKAGNALLKQAEDAAIAVSKTRPGKAFSNAFITGVPGNKVLNGILKTFRDRDRGALRSSVREAKNSEEIFEIISKETGHPVENVRSVITEGVERSRGYYDFKMENLSPETVKDILLNETSALVIDHYVKKNRSQLQKEVTSGFKMSPLSDTARDGSEMSYLRHALTPEGRKIVGAKAEEARKLEEAERKFGVKSPEKKHPAGTMREFRGQSIDELNAKSEQGLLKGYEGKKFKIFHEDPILLQAHRDVAHKRQMAVYETFKEAGKTFGMNTSGVSDEAIKAAGLVKGPFGYAFPPEILAQMKPYFNAVFNPEQSHKYIQQFEEVNKIWKRWTLSPFPSYHVRNLVGNTFNNFVVGVSNPQMYEHAFRVMRQASPDAKVAGYTYKEIENLADEFGIRSGGIFANDLETTIRGEIGQGRWLTLDADQKAIAMGRRVGEAAEDWTRLANFIDGLNKGLSPKEASKRVDEALFDYGDITETEKKLRDRAFPFYTWARKNIPFQAANMIKHPGKYKAIDTIRMNIENNTEKGSDEELLSAWMLDNYPVRVRWNEEKGQGEYFLLNNWLPAADVWKAASSPTQLFKDLLGPVPKALWELASNKSLFNEQELSWNEGSDFLGMDVSSHTKNLLKNIRLLAEADNFVKAAHPEEYKKHILNSTENRSPLEALLNFTTGIKTFTNKASAEKQFNVGDKRKTYEEELKTFNKLAASKANKEELQAQLKRVLKAAKDFKKLRK